MSTTQLSEFEAETIELAKFLFPADDPHPDAPEIPFAVGDRVRVIGDDEAVVFKAEIGHETEVLATVPGLGLSIIDTGHTDPLGERIIQGYLPEHLEAV